MESEIRRNQPHPLVVILITLIASFLGLQVIGPMLGFIIALPFYPGSMIEMANGLKNPISDPTLKVPYFIMQGTGSLIGLIIIPSLLMKSFRISDSQYFRNNFFVSPALIILILVIIFNGVNSFFIEWNQNIQFPHFLEELEKKLKDLEMHLGEVSNYLTTFDSHTQVFIALIVMAIFPAIGEELVFRGIIQREFYKGTNNIHISIWVSAIIFSAIHLQFYGFVPRMLLGALFGYLYYWSGNLWMPILAHFVNNGFTVIAMYLHQQGSIDVDVETTESAPLPAVIGSLVFTIILLYLFKTFYDKRALSPASQADDEGKEL